MEVAESSVTFYVDKLVKHNKPGTHVSNWNLQPILLMIKFLLSVVSRNIYNVQNKLEVNRPNYSLVMLNHFDSYCVKRYGESLG